MNYALSDPLLINKVGEVNEAEWVVELNLTQEDVDNIIKAKSALSQIDNMLVTTTTNLDGENVVEFVFGDESGQDSIDTDTWNVKFVDQQRVEYIPSVVQKIVPPAVFGQMVGLTKTSVERTLPILPENISEEIVRSGIIKPYRTLKIRRKADGK